MRRLWRTAKELFTPDLEAIISDGLIDAELQLLRAQDACARAQADVWYAQQRVQRLRARKEVYVIRPKNLGGDSQDVTGMKDDDLYQLIADQEKAISELEKIQAKPKRLQKEIDDRRAGIEALVKMLDERDTKTTA